MPWTDEDWMLNRINASRKSDEQVTVDNAKGIDVPVQMRLEFEKTYGEVKVNALFGEASHLQKAEMMLLEIEEGKISQQKRYENLIDIAYQIEYARDSKLSVDSFVGEKCWNLHSYIPIWMGCSVKTSDWYFSAFDFQEKRMCISAEILEKMKNWLFFSEEADVNLPKKAFFEYIFELVYISLKEFFEEVKAEIMGK